MDPTTVTTAADAGFLVPIYVVYGIAALALTAALARTLFRNGATFLNGVFEETGMAEAVNHLLVIGFYMLNLGYAFLIFKTGDALTVRAAVELLVQKLGILLASLGAIHFVNMYVFFRMRRRGLVAELPIPVTPQVQMTWEPAGTPA